jgi:hypothetical protein
VGPKAFAGNLLHNYTVVATDTRLPYMYPGASTASQNECAVNTSHVDVKNLQEVGT